jgi:hypothetical protein
MSSLCNSKTSLSALSGERRSPLIKVPFEDFTSLMKTWARDELRLYRGKGARPTTHLAVLAPHFRVHPAEDLAVKIAIGRVRDGFRVGLPPDLDPYALGRERDLLGHKGIVEGIHMEGGIRHRGGSGGRGGECSRVLDAVACHCGMEGATRSRDGGSCRGCGGEGRVGRRRHSEARALGQLPLCHSR